MLVLLLSRNNNSKPKSHALSAPDLHKIKATSSHEKTDRECIGVVSESLEGPGVVHSSVCDTLVLLSHVAHVELQLIPLVETWSCHHPSCRPVALRVRLQDVVTNAGALDEGRMHGPFPVSEPPHTSCPR